MTRVIHTPYYGSATVRAVSPTSLHQLCPPVQTEPIDRSPSIADAMRSSGVMRRPAQSAAAQS